MSCVLGGSAVDRRGSACAMAVGLGMGVSRCVRVVFMDCESGSGAFWARRTSRLALAVSSRLGRGGWVLMGVIRDVLAWGV